MEPNPKFVLRLAEPSDAADWVAQLNRAGGETKFCSFDANGYPRSVEEETKRMKELQDSNYKDGVLIVARDSETNELVGTGGCMRILRRRQDHVFDLGLVVSQSHWGQGVGRAMMERMIEEARSRGGRKISLDFNSDNSKAQRMYERLGFVQEGRMRNQLCVDGQYKDLVMMSLFLKK